MLILDFNTNIAHWLISIYGLNFLSTVPNI